MKALTAAPLLLLAYIVLEATLGPLVWLKVTIPALQAAAQALPH